MKGGCGQAIVISMAFVFVAGLAYQGCGRGGFGSSANGSSSAVEEKIGDVGGVAISSGEIDRAIQQGAQQFGGRQVPPAFELLLAGQALSGVVQQKSLLALAQSKGVPMDDASISKFLDGQFDPAKIRQELERNGQLKPGASAAEFDATIKRLTGGKSLAEVVTKQRAQILTDLKDPEKGAVLRGQISTGMLVESVKAKINPSDDDLRKSFDVYEVKRISFPSGPGSQEKADAALAKIRGGATFESVLDANSPAPAKGAKKASEATQKLPASLVSSNPDYAAIRTLKPGETTGVVKGAYDLSITKLVRISNELPKDFATNKAKYLEQYRTQEASRIIEADLKAYAESNPPKFSSPAYEALWKYSKLSAGANPLLGGAGGPPADESKLREVIDLAKKAGTSGPGASLATSIRAAAFEQLYSRATNKEPLRTEYIETLKAQVAVRDDFDARMKLVGEFASQKKLTEATDELLAAAKANTQYDAQGQDRFNTVTSRLLQLKKEGSVPAETERAILAEQDRWRSEKKKSDEAAAAAARQQAEDARRAAAATKTPPAGAKPTVKDVPKTP